MLPVANIYRFLRRFSPYLLAVWVALIIIFSSLPDLPRASIRTDSFELRLDYLLHFLEYGGLAALVVLTFMPKATRVTSRGVMAAAALLFLFAALDESHQLLIPGRSFNYYDMLCDFAGIVTGIAAMVRINRFVQ